VAYRSEKHPYVSRAGLKLQAALFAFDLNVADQCCADFGCNVGGFTDCLLQKGASRVYAIDTGYGVLAYKLRKDPRVEVMERTNAMHVELPEAVPIVTIDVAWTPQHHILPSAMRVLAPGGNVISLIKPHYEADRKLLKRGVLQPEQAAEVLSETRTRIEAAGFVIKQLIESPVTGQKGNVEYLAWLIPAD
jgi:23S rRNA (cytidine1920-2'-O)/16S rRNA (cytidine1409-2'-O)-methyltransferase